MSWWSGSVYLGSQTFAAALSPIASDRTDGSPRDSGDTGPQVFLSYSHDSGAHRAWVRQLAEQLRANGVDVILDQWDLRAGADVVRFMEQGIMEADRVLMVCTANYVAKAEERKGGAGYEGMIVTGQVARATQTIKFVPIVRDNSSESLIPAFLGSGGPDGVLRQVELAHRRQVQLAERSPVKRCVPGGHCNAVPLWRNDLQRAGESRRDFQLCQRPQGGRSRADDACGDVSSKCLGPQGYAWECVGMAPG